MTETENPLQHRLKKEEFYDFVKACRAKAKSPLHYSNDEWFLKHYLELRGVILPPEIAIYKMNHNFKNSSLMRSRYEIMDDAARYYTVFIKKYATVIDSAFKNCVHQSKGYFDLSVKEVKDILLRLVQELKSERKYIKEAAFAFQCSLIVLYCNIHIELTEKVGKLLVKIKYNDISKIVGEIGKVKRQDAFECNNVYALTMMTVAAIIKYSSISQRFALYLADVGLLATLTVHITEASYMNYLHEQSFSLIVDYALGIVYNIAYHSDSKTKQKFDATKKALINFPKGDNNFRELQIMLSLVYTMDEHELRFLSHESNVVNTVIICMKEALKFKYRRFNGISLCQLADGLTKLTIKSSNISEIVLTEGALSALVKMLHYKNVKENTSAVLCIQALAQDITVRSTLLEFPDLVTALADLRKTTSLQLEMIIDEILKTLRSCTQEDSPDNMVSGAAAEPSLIANTSNQARDLAIRSQSVPAANDDSAVGVKKWENFSLNENHRSTQPFVYCILLDQSTHVTKVVQQEEKFTARGMSESLRPEDEQTIRRHWTLLISEVDATHIIVELISYGVFDVDDKREILGHNSRRKRTETMLQKLLNAGSGPAFARFIDVLELNHKHVVEELKKKSA
ncbi:unnamed protein product [Lymnaea stagnalis]|uniref:CARD domain-containing protein n=1 Tax=Lymnaea stagnalis TaxID=6523 RepID=A0AAV2I9I2_LYMST